jgi:SAM-dependent methyltransferase
VDLRSLTLYLPRGEVRARVADGAGERDERLEGAAVARTLAAALPLLPVLEAAAGGPARALSVDFVARMATVTTAATPPPGPRLPTPAQVQVPLARLEAAGSALADLARAVLAEVRPPRVDDAGQDLDAAFWGGLYRAGGDGWELGRAAPPLVRWVAARDLRGKRALVVGCGRGHEARMLAAAGAQVVAVDFSAEAIARARELAAAERLTIDFRVADLFTLGEAPERYDLFCEHCCFCAIRPEQRPAYARVAAQVVKPGGTLLGLFWSHGRPGGPPYSVTAGELRAQFVPPFTLRTLEVPADSVGGRLGQELLLELTR